VSCIPTCGLKELKTNKTSTLTPVDIGLASPVLLASTSAGDYYYVVTCLIDEQLPKLFLVSDPVAGLATLEDPALQDTLTGGDVTQCGLLPLSSS
jgi:hypothetical protein